MQCLGMQNKLCSTPFGIGELSNVVDEGNSGGALHLDPINELHALDHGLKAA
jgi:hypothetical protein